MHPGKMKHEQLRRHLINAGRHAKPDTRVPFAFEKRIMAQLGKARSLDPWLLWNRILWRCAAPCVAFTLLAGAFTWLGPSHNQSSDSLTADLETVVYAPLVTTQEVW